MASSELQYFISMKSFSDFSEVGQTAIYKDWPAGWSLVLTDIRGSTKAIQEGRYKQVNMIGAASIAAYVKCAGTHEVPYVFGGDGATLLIPNSMRPEILEELKSLQNVARLQFSLDLRVGYIDVETLKSMGQPLKVAKFELSAGNYLAQFTGGAISLAENLVKANSPQASILSSENPNEARDIQGISCRLRPLKSTHGKILTLLCKPKDDRTAIETIQYVVEKLNLILGTSSTSYSPVQSKKMFWSLLPMTTPDEVRLLGKSKSFFKLIGQFLFAWISNLSLRYEFNMGGFIPKKYKQELQTNSDFRKFDETLRMVLDCTESQINGIQNLFEELHHSGKIFYGMHISNEALMTCMVHSPTQNRHIHFIDGADGGYAVAAIVLKKQMALGI